MEFDIVELGEEENENCQDFDIVVVVAAAAVVVVVEGMSWCWADRNLQELEVMCSMHCRNPN